LRESGEGRFSESDIRKWMQEAKDNGEAVGDFVLSRYGIELLSEMRKQHNLNLRDKRLRKNKESL